MCQQQALRVDRNHECMYYIYNKYRVLHTHRLEGTCAQLTLYYQPLRLYYMTWYNTAKFPSSMRGNCE